MNRDYAVRVLTHYFRTVWEKAGLKWDSDSNAEVEGIVDSIIAAASPNVTKIQEDAYQAGFNAGKGVKG